MLVSLLRPVGHATAEAGDGVEALAQVAAWRPDLVICDLLMPTMDGYEFARSLRADPALPQPEIVFFTATFVADEARTLAAACGVRWLLTKPCEPEEILRTVNEALARAEAPPPPAGTGFDREHLRFLTDRLSDKVGELEQANRRLSALTELNLQLASERDPLRLLDTVAQGACALLGARWAVLRARTRNGEAAATRPATRRRSACRPPSGPCTGCWWRPWSRWSAAGAGCCWPTAPTARPSTPTTSGCWRSMRRRPAASTRTAACTARSSTPPTGCRSRSRSARAPPACCTRPTRAWSSGCAPARPSCMK
ncbi:response regulator [Piscinibacter sakaiensis]|uniref:response regulator n=1 Tax=Piscinibacter sakaiensis TaxID=1547922 RepID=UPI00372BE0C0